MTRPTVGAGAGLLRCPHCHAPLGQGERVWTCPAGHRFDVARQGYVNLVAGRVRHPGDTPEMLDARDAVLRAGHLDVVTHAVVAACRRHLPPGALVEVGAGTAHHLAAVSRALGGRAAVAMDVSVAAARRAARADPSITAVVADAWEPWPLLDRVAAGVLTIFAPRNAAEAARVLVAGGQLLVVTPAADHLAELRGPLGLLEVEPGKSERLAAGMAEHLDPVDATDVRVTRLVDREAARALAAMGPSANHLDADDLDARVAALPGRTTVTVAVELHRFRSRGTTVTSP